MKTTPRRRLAMLGTATAAGVLLGVQPALAHVGVEPEEAEAGGYGTVDFKVPNEKDDASTTKVEINLPTDHPLASVMPEPVPGWDAEVTKSDLDKPVEAHGEKITEAVTKITWTGGKIGPGEFQRFPVSMGELPHDTDRLVFKALQTYDDKETVRWIEVPEKGAPEPENPAPVLELTSAEGGTPSHGGPDAEAHHAAAGGSGGDDGTDTTARVLGVAGIVIGVAGVAFGVLAGRRRTA